MLSRKGAISGTVVTDILAFLAGSIEKDCIQSRKGFRYREQKAGESFSVHLDELTARVTSLTPFGYAGTLYCSPY